ncbi:glycosyltransferase [Leptolyngbya sp. 7M]|uniref:glycosyltransferase n=1 Tax=Leptolyngbya sp. 7M TaxID=2812896 RepID=UPI001B8BD87E|nr:glycosyltransferase [Leptolyngbya sp. 7M]QYO62430.1 glycosyltransferase [Leptolyngbya sp. 7M]
MHITILTIGSRGDVQPYVALGMGLKAAGHEVCVATEADYEPFVTDCGLQFARLPGNTRERHETEAWKHYLTKEANNIVSAIWIRPFMPKESKPCCGCWPPLRLTWLKNCGIA